MSKKLNMLLAGAAAGLSLATGAQAQTFSGAQSLEISDFIGAVTIKTDGKMSVTKSDGTDASYKTHIKQDGGALRIYSDEDPDEGRWWDDVNWRRDHEKAFANYLKAYPSLTITVPVGTALAFDNAVVKLEAGDTKGAFSAEDGYVEGRIGDITTGNIAIHSSADLIVGDAAGALTVSIYGSGDFSAGEAAELTAIIHGSGDVKIGDISGPASASVHGSGDIILGDVGGAIELSTHGSGDIRAAKVSGGADIATMGSGDITLGGVDGETEATSYGSGDVRINAGRAQNLHVRVSGSGDFIMTGLAINPDVAANGSGDIRISKHEGAVQARGRGDIVISGVNYSDDD